MNKLTPALILIGTTALAAAQEAVTPAAPALTPDTITGFVQSLAAQAPWLLAALSVIGVLRLIFKPAMTFLHATVKATPSMKDDEWLAKVEASAWLGWFVWSLDLLASVKLTHPKAINTNDPK